MSEEPEAQVPVQDREAARAFVVDHDGAVLLFRGCDSAHLERGEWWFTPGGGLDAGETIEDAARRELREETGLVVDELGPVVFRRNAVFEFEGVEYHQTEAFFCVRTDRFDLDRSGWTEIERRTMLDHRWWSHADLVATDEIIFPAELPEILASLL